ncbi:NAD-dependent epimerase/dehydratase family protein [Nonomuraea endophytica]|uniref:2'-hydroxyisoflavone reductase n=1 Tax=Nonomuraea endophytica TaxID=714136 RepID=A0A7W8ABJ4_9ACTN|nr:NAD-dependent epimerase/dehydratase family protein [Nonomuraea endophytica]MBB5083137.1 2'-hydroxyisoflavone reductase [Nonomuraea endophytica]
MRVLVIGGSAFLGRAIVQEALDRGHEVTTFNRGRSAPDLPGVEAVHGDREVTADLERLVDGRTWDLVVDSSGYVPKVVGDAVRLLSGRAATYAFISTISAFKNFPAEQTSEDSPLWDCAPDAGPDAGDYGVLKAGCERAVEQGFAGNALIIQPGLILGPYENVARLPWWLNRISKGGKVLAPGDPAQPMQLIDARDIAVFTLDQAEKGVADRFVVTGPEGNTTYGEWLEMCKRETGSDAEFVWVADDFLIEHEAGVWMELPLWAPAQPDMANFWTVSTAKAEAAGLRSRSVADTVRDTWEWLRHIPEDERVFGKKHAHGIAPEKEQAILAAWAARSA